MALIALAVPARSFAQAGGQDINGDGRVDAVFTQKQAYNQVCFGNGKGNFTTCSDLIGAGQFTLSDQVNTTASALVDWDGDGDLDIALAMEGRSSVVCHNDGGGQFNTGTGCVELYGHATFPYDSQDVAAGDLNADGAPDLVFATGGNLGNPQSQPNLVCLGSNTGASACSEVGTTLAASTGVALGDIDSDADLDVLVSNRGTQNEVCLNSGNGTSFDCRAIPRATNITATGLSNAVAVGNLPLNSTPPDQYLDIAFANDGQNERCFGNGNWSGSNVGLDCSGWNNTVGSRSLDVAVANIHTGLVGDEVLFAKEDAMNVFCFFTFTCTTAFNQAAVEASVDLAVRDINVDGKLDVVVANVGVTAGVSSTYIGNGFGTSVIANSTFQPTSITLSGGTVGPTVDTVPPAFTGATNVTVEAAGSNGATAQFTVTAVDVEDGARSVSCSPASGSLFALGNTTVTCTSSDTSNNVGTATFLVMVRDTTGPVITVPSNLSIFATPGQTTAAVPFVASALDAVDGAVSGVLCFNTATNFGVSPGAQLPAGTITLMCGAYDSRQNYGQASFSVTVITNVDGDGMLDNVDPDDDNDGIADSLDTQSNVVSTDYAFDATNTGTVTRNGWAVTIEPASGSYAVRASIAGTPGTAPAVISAYCGFRRKELRLDTAGETVEWRCDGGTLAVKFVSGAAEFWKLLFSGGTSAWERTTPTANGDAASAGSPVTADPANTAPIVVALFNEALTQIGSFSLDPGESMDVEVVDGELQLELLNGGPDGQVVVTLFNQPVTLQQGNGPATFSMTQTVFASGTAAVTTWDPIFPSSAYSPWQAQCSAAPSVGPNANWVNPHAAFSFPLGSHVWENIPPFNFAANWINAWDNLSSRGPIGPDGRQNWTKYTTQVTGEGDFVVQFLADNCSWIYLDDQLIGVQDDNWQQNGTGRYPLTLTGAGSHTLSFIILDGGGAAGGKFRLETRQSFIDGGGDPDDLPVKGPSTTTVSFGAGPFTYTGSAFTATALVSPDGAATIEYTGDCTNAGNTCTATATYDGDATHHGSTATASITIDPAPTTTTVGFDAASYVYTGSAIEASASGGATIEYSGSCINVGTCTATATTAGDANHTASSAVASVDITPASTTTTVSFSAPSYVYNGSAIAATASAGATIAYSGSCTNAGTCTATATTAGDANHTGSSAVASAEITKASTTTTVSFSAGSYVYTGSAIEATASAGATIAYSGSCTNVGTCVATATNPGDANHTSSSAVATSEVTKASTTTTVSFGAGPFVYTGSAFTATASATFGTPAIVYSGDCTNAGNTCRATATYGGGVNHTGSSNSATITIAKRPTVTTVTFGAGPFVYKGTAFTATASVSPSGTATIVYSGNCVIPGTTCVATATYAGNANQLPSSGTATAVITIWPSCQAPNKKGHGACEEPKTNKDNYSMKQGTVLAISAKSGVRKNDGKTPATIELVSGPSRGTLTLAADGSFVYTPAPGFVGTDSFRYIARSVQGIASDDELVTIQVTKKRGNDDDCSFSDHDRDHDRDRDWSHKSNKYKGSKKHDHDDDDDDDRDRDRDR